MNRTHISSMYKITIALLFGAIVSSGAQAPQNFPGSDSLMKTVLEHNKSLLAARELYQVAIMDAGTGNTPPDPQVEFGYLFGNPSVTENRIDFSVSQQIDFPTAYVHMSRLRQVKTVKAELMYTVTRQEILLMARQLWIERIYLNKQEQLLSGRLRNSEKMVDHYRQKLIAGEEGQLSFSQSNLQTIALQNEYEKIKAKIRSNQVALNEISGGLAIEITETIFPPSAKLIPDSVLQDYHNSPEWQLYNLESELKEQQKNLAVSKNLPKLSAGYYSESILDQKFKGFQVGLSVPLWENTNRIKHAKSEVIFAEADANRFESHQQKEVLQKLDQLESLKNQAEKLEKALGLVNDEELLSVALEIGEISLSEYMYSSDLYFRNVRSLLEFKRDQLLLEADLMKVYL
ncbi:MAG: TolC family protein [Bacteroidales bacterium]|nr:TolC family protein [Bacteroidales bacterium]